MSTREQAPAPSPIAVTIDLLGDRLTVSVLREAFVDHVRRFSGWIERLGAPPAMLTMRLKTLVDGGLMERRPQPNTTDRYDYILTELGLATWEFLVSVWAWEREWSPEGAVQPELVHLDCGHRGPPELICTRCDGSVAVRDVAVEFDGDPLVIAASNGRRRSTSTSPLSVDRADLRVSLVMEAIGDRWSALVVGLALAGVRRFGEFQSILGISPTTLTERLSRLSRAGILTRPDGDTSRDYRLTPRGRGLFATFAFLIAWAQMAFPTAEWNGPRLRHPACGAPLAPGLRCRGCAASLDRTSVRFDPSSSFDRS